MRTALVMLSLSAGSAAYASDFSTRAGCLAELATQIEISQLATNSLPYVGTLLDAAPEGAKTEAATALAAITAEAAAREAVAEALFRLCDAYP